MAIKRQKVLCRGETGYCQRDSLLSADALLRLTKGEEILAQPHQAQRIEEERSRKQGQNGGEKPV